MVRCKRTINGGQVANSSFACNAIGDGFTHHLSWYFSDVFLESIQSPAQRYLKWFVHVSMWHCRDTVTCNVSGDSGFKLPHYNSFTRCCPTPPRQCKGVVKRMESCFTTPTLCPSRTSVWPYHHRHCVGTNRVGNRLGQRPVLQSVGCARPSCSAT